tara:strand:- start:18157 stop:19338 length:1182 start_codon:yes stop_codon:yes gene_type:complete
MIKCNTCGSASYEFLFENSIKSTARMKKIPNKVIICKNCGHVFLDYFFLEQKDLENYYQNNNPFEKVEQLDPAHQKVRTEQLNFVINNIKEVKKDFKFLDIGCGAGYFLSLVKQRGFYCEGVERSNMMCEMINEHYKIKCTNTSFEELRLENKFDVVSIITVLEHLYNPKRCIEKISELIKEDGYLFIEIPDTEFPRHDILPDYLAFEHIHHWTKNSLSNLLQLSGFETIHYEQKRNDDDSGNPENVLRVLAKKNNLLPRNLLVNDYVKQSKNLKEFKENHNKFVQKFQIKIDNILKKLKNENLNIYCAGLHTSTLLSLFPNLSTKIINIYDSDEGLKNTKLNNFQVSSSKEINNKTLKNFLMSTTNHEHTIYKFLKSINNEFKVYGLYNDFD